MALKLHHLPSLGEGQGWGRPSHFGKERVPKATIDRDEMRRCVLCGKPREQVAKLILGLHGGICVECVDLCNDVIKGEVYPAEQYNYLESVPKPKEIFNVLSQYVIGQDRAKRALAVAV